MPWREIVFLLIACGLVTGEQKLGKSPKFDVRVCGEDGVKTDSSCHTNVLRLIFLSSELADSFCQLSGGNLVTVKTIRQSEQLRNFDKKLTIWTHWKNCSAWEISNNYKNLVARNCKSKIGVMCEWERWAASGKCPENYRRIGRKCYRVFDDLLHSIIPPFSEDEARNVFEKKCEKEGARLAMMATEMDRSAILSVIQGNSRISVMVKATKTSTMIIYGDNEVQSGLAIPFENNAAPLGFVCEKKITKTMKFQKRSSSKFQDGFMNFDEKCTLKAVSWNLPQKWEKAKEYCEREGKETLLASIHSHYDNAIVHLARLFFQNDTWIGIKRSLEGPTKWSDGTNIVFNNSLRFERKPNLCGVMTEDGQWNFTSCDVKKPFSCFKRPVIMPLPKPCKSDDAIEFNNTCYSTKKCKGTKQWNPITIRSKGQLAFLLNLARKHQKQCLLLSNKSDVNFFGYDASMVPSDSSLRYIDHRGKWIPACNGNSITICEQSGPASKATSTRSTTSSPLRGSDDRGAHYWIFIISILSCLLGTIIVIFGVAVYCLVFRPQRAAPQAIKLELKPKPQPKPSATVKNAPSRSALYPSPLPIMLPAVTPVEDENAMEEIYEPMDDIC